jgi:hypothetical protein
MRREEGEGMRAVAVLFGVLLAMAGCSQTSSAPEQGEKEDVEQAVEETPDGQKVQKEVSVPADVPAYTLTKDEAGMVQGFGVRNLAASTDVTSEQDLESITRELWAETEEDILAVSFYPNEPGADVSGTAQAFLSEGAARAFISAQYTDPSEADVEGQVREAMANDGLLVISLQDEVESMEREMCAEWDTTTMGTPPPEFNCEDL